jgi:molybdopterin-guanine dinucleotide biosynthesis protein
MISGGSVDSMAFRQFKFLTYIFQSISAHYLKQVLHNGLDIDTMRADTPIFRNDGAKNFVVLSSRFISVGVGQD